ncbi:MAG: hypothetical protein KF805_05175 [Phycisphaeraceae bacterium]|nr:hypothetical protein [Phycisphaeraceae bacterium]
MNTSNQSQNPSAQPRMSRPIALADLTEDLLWPKLLRVPALALRPASITIGFFGLLIASLVGDLSRLWRPARDPSLGTILSDELERGASGFWRETLRGIQTADGSAFHNAFSALIRIPRVLWEEFSWGSLIGIISLGILLIAGGAIARIAACDFAHGVRISWVEALGFAIKRWVSLIFCFAGPLLVAGIVYAIIAAVGWALFSPAWAQAIGAVLFVLALLGATLAVALLVLTLLGAPLLVPAVACEGADAIEAMQRAFAYVPARPLRYGLYALLTAIVGMVAVAAAVAVATGVTSFALSAAGAWVKQPPRLLLEPLAPPDGAAEWILRLWIGLPLAIAGAYAFSVLFSGCTVIYLLLRRVVDGQTVTDIWVPGVVPGTAMPTDAGAGANPIDASVSREAGDED